MSHPSPSATAQPQPLSSSSFPTFAELAERMQRLQAAAQDVLAGFAAAEQDPESAPQPAPTDRSKTRGYYLSPATAEQERELLKRYRAQDLGDLLAQTHLLLAGLVRIMKTTPHDLRVRGYVIASLGCLLEQACVLVLRMRNVYGAMEKAGA